MLVVQAAEEAAEVPADPDAEAISDSRLLTWSLLHSGQSMGFGCAVRKTSLSNRAPHALHSYS